MPRLLQLVLAGTLAAAGLGSASAADFQGRLADGTASTTCTVSGPSRCTMFYNPLLDITILNNWNIGEGHWSASAARFSAQALAETAGYNATGLSGWGLPTGDGLAGPGAENQWRSIWNQVGGTFAGLSAQFDGVQQFEDYWSSTPSAANPGSAWIFITAIGGQTSASSIVSFYTVAVRPGDVMTAVPEQPTAAMLLAGLGALLMAVRRRAVPGLRRCGVAGQGPHHALPATG